MSLLFTILEVADIALNRAKDTTEEIIDAGRKFYCNLHANHPAWTVARQFSDSSIILRAIDRMCDDGTYTPPPLPQAPFIGGQCPKNYYLRLCVECDQYQITSASNPGNFQNKLYASLDTQGQFIVQGPIESVSFSVRGDCPKISGGPLVCTFGRQEVWATVVGANGTFERRMDLKVEGCFGATNRELGGSSYVLRDSLSPLEIIPRTTDGSADDCGSLPPEYPTEPDPTDPELINTVTVTNINNESYDYNVTVNRDENNTINFPATIVVNDVTMTMDITGISILVNNNNNKPSGGGSGGVAEDEPVETLDENANKELRIEAGGIEEDVPSIHALIVSITLMPANAKVSSGMGTADKIFPGWVMFKVGSDYLPRQFIDFENSYFLAPEGATGYAITILTGYSASIFKAFFVEV